MASISIFITYVFFARNVDLMRIEFQMTRHMCLDMSLSIDTCYEFRI